MNISQNIYKLADQVSGTAIDLPDIQVSRYAIEQVPDYVKENTYKQTVLVADENTKYAAGEKLQNLLTETGVDAKLVLLRPNRHGQVIADEQTIVQLLLETPPKTELLIAVGSGTIHDIVRFVGFKMNIPFLSVPTAASVDGFTSKGAPLILRGEKRTIQTAFPIAVFADITVLKAAPRQLTAAGFGDIIGKYTSLLDWEISALVGGEPYNKLAADITRKSLVTCVENVEKIAAADEEGVRILTEALIESGLVMLLLDFSRPASGAEHHLSHYWEMDLLKSDKPQIYHGAKVGAATAIVTELYKRFASCYQPAGDPGKGTISDKIEKLYKNWSYIEKAIEALPDPSSIIQLLRKVGGPGVPGELGIPERLVEQSLNEAYQLRDRWTGLRLINMIKKEPLNYPLSEMCWPDEL
ncbi:iron-containing alcohol dehydrogenase [Sediminibacillus dalangtanensis]|uniref:Iron-containing alcohol dehydrogenase n=1 Tax=Sediminibacillus dalangtanensis TaxID=2729421 RepID=A0ABX7VNQ1_9BACI|nr:sn-glycerol-1-phosphate dehydrogenase [Sediminibacillus dalangtanensis]QTM98048.1 iron-containing alcohol dehydrogenase [Sediminibacillus dalangtanensis]